MLRTLQTARHSLHLEQTRIDTLANNLANAATSGFRQVLTRVTEQNAIPVANADPGPDDTAAIARPLDLPRPPGAADWVTERKLLMSQALDMRPGAVQQTGRHLDLAISGRGFFVVRDREGNEMLTRDGGFSLDDEGNLATAAGLQVQGTGGPIAAGGGLLTVDADGSVRVDGQERGRLRLVEAGDPHGLTPRGDGLLMAAAAQALADVPAGEAVVLQGHLEGSNVDAVRTLVDMIAAQRAFEVGAKVLQANDEMLGQSVNTLGRVT